MELVDLKEDIKQIAYMLKRMLNADVIAVDRHLNSLINTFEYEKKPIDIQINSVVGNVIVSGEMKIVEDKSCFEECVNCPQFEECEIASIVGVPIITYQGCIGVIALLIRKRKDYRLEWTFEDAVVFLEKIAEMLGNKIQNCMYIQKIENIPGLMHSVLKFHRISSAVSAKKTGRIPYEKSGKRTVRLKHKSNRYHRKRFKRAFGKRIVFRQVVLLCVA